MTDEQAKLRQRPQYESFLILSKEITGKVEEICQKDPIVVDKSIGEQGLTSSWEDGVYRVPNEKIAAELRNQKLHETSSQSLIAQVAPQFEKLSLNTLPRIWN